MTIFRRKRLILLATVALGAAQGSGVGIGPSTPASACCLTDWLFGRGTYAAGYAPLPTVYPAAMPSAYAAGYAPAAVTPVPQSGLFPAGVLTPSAGPLGTIRSNFGGYSGFGSAVAQPVGRVAVNPIAADPIATTTSIRGTAGGYNSFRPFLPAASNIPAGIPGAGLPTFGGLPSAYGYRANRIATTGPAYTPLNNPSVYTGRPTLGYPTAANRLRGVDSAATIGATNTYPTSGIGTTYAAGYGGTPLTAANLPASATYGGTIQPVPTGSVTTLPITAAPSIATPSIATPSITGTRPALGGGLRRFFGSLLGRGYQNQTYTAPVTYYRPVNQIDPMTGVGSVVQAGCASTENLSTYTPVQQYAPSLLPSPSSSITASEPSMLPSSIMPSSVAPPSVPAPAPMYPSATLADPIDPSPQDRFIAPSDYQTPLSRGFDGSIQPQPSVPARNEDLRPLQQPRLESRFEPSPEASFRARRGSDAESSAENRTRPSDDPAYRTYRGNEDRQTLNRPSTEPRFDRSIDREPLLNDPDRQRGNDPSQNRRDDSDDSDDSRGYWELQDAADSTAMIRPRRLRPWTGRTAQPIEGLSPTSSTNASGAVSTQRDETLSGRRSAIAPPLPARTSSDRRRSLSGAQGYEVSVKRSRWQPKLGQPSSALPAPVRSPKPSPEPSQEVRRDNTWRPVR